MTEQAITLSIYQQAVLDWWNIKRGSAILKAGAGAGKTKMIELSLGVLPSNWSVQCFAFNTSIAKELNVRLEKVREQRGSDLRGFRAGTFHSVGGYAVARHLGKRSVRELNTDDKKCRKLCEGWLGEIEYAMYADFICHLVAYAKGEGIGAIAPDTDDRWYALIAHHDLYLDSEEATEAKAVELARELLQRSNQAAKNCLIDFDDMLYLPLLWKCRLWQNDVVMVDEAQDTNPVRRALAKLALKPGGRLLAVGDDRQAINGFTGASHDALDIIKREFNAVEMTLPISYRCAKSIIALAQTVNPDIKEWDKAPEGIVEDDIPLNEALQVLGPHDAILCRNTAPLIETAYRLIAQGVPCKVLGREIGQGLINLIKKMRAKGLEQLYQKLHEYREREVAKFMAKGEEGKAEAVTDRVSCLHVIIDHLPEGKDRTIPKLIEKIEGMFSDTNGVLMLGTVHKAKGREWNRVAILEPQLMPSRWARQDWQVQQEQNLIYVAYTRAQTHLMILRSQPKKKNDKARAEEQAKGDAA